MELVVVNLGSVTLLFSEIVFVDLVGLFELGVGFVVI